MEPRKYFIINNPTSGSRGKNQKVLREVVDYFTQKNVPADLHLTSPTQNAWDIVQEKCDTSYTDLLVVGGDGTINESVNGLQPDIPLSIIPAGTGNDFVKMLNLGKTLSEQLDTVLNGRIHRIDLGECNGRKFVNGVGIGFDGQIVEDMRRKKVPLLSGHAKYYYHVLQILASYKERTFQFELDREAYKQELILMTVGNGSTFGGGFKLMPNARLDDGLLEVCCIGAISALRRFLNVGRLSNGSHGQLPEVRFYQAREITLATHDYLFAHMDGEAIGKPPFSIRVLPASLSIRTRLA